MSFRKNAKRFAYRAARATGMFALSRLLFARRLRILCYHGFEYRDEARFRPSLFMSAERFERRLALLRRQGYTVLALDEALRRLREGSLPRGAVVLTIDDGFHSVLEVAVPLLRRYGMPATLYLTSYYMGRDMPVFRLAVQYLFWRASTVDPSDLQVALRDFGLELDGTESTEGLIRRIVLFGESRCDETGRQSMLERLAEALGQDYRALCEARQFSIVGPEDLRVLEASGVEIALHTHRHVFPIEDPQRARREIEDNRAAIEPVLGRRLRHFCYPSGIWSPECFGILREAGVASAVTSEPGLNGADTEPLALYRILDRNDLDEIEFEAELSGFGELLRYLRRFRLALLGREQQQKSIHPDAL